MVIAFGVMASAETTYTRDVARIMQAKCQQCHRPNDVAPFALMTYDDAVTYAEDIKQALKNKTMPPWKPVPGFNEFLGSYAVTDDERNTILAWIDGGAPQGDLADMPPPLPVSQSRWELGEPDMILTMPEYTPPVRATDTYRCFVLPTGLSGNRFISAMQAAPGNPQVVHHVVLYLDETGESMKLDGKDGQPGYNCFGGPNLSNAGDLLHGTTLGAWVPGARTRRLADDIGVPITKGAHIVMQVHYHPGGREGADKTQLGIWFADSASIKHRLINIPVVNTEFVIPAGASAYEVKAALPINPFLTGKIVTVTPHMHNLGRQIKVEVEDRDGTKRPVIYIDNWDFNWQGSYTPVDPVPMPAGSTVRVTSIFDNSAGNPKNPNNPIAPVGWGERTSDEMCVALIGVIFDNEAALRLPFSAGSK
jgi:mono/diheme cytochrome c family protein